MSAAAVEIFRSPRRADCDERAFMLAAVGIASTLGCDGDDFTLLVAAADAAPGLDHLGQYELETLGKPLPPPPAPRLHRGAWLGSLVYALVLLGVAFAVSAGLWRLDAFDTGELDASRVQAGQWWRVWTALTLHVDGAHLTANTAAGVWFGYLAGRLMGTGNAWLLIVLGAGFANWIEATFGPAAHRAVGASTAVFTALGLLSAYSWRTRFRYPQRWASRWGPLVAGVILLSWTGTGAQEINAAPAVGGPTVDVLAHALGFAVGIALGTVAALSAATRMLDRIPQTLAGLLALTPLVVAWIRALGS